MRTADTAPGVSAGPRYTDAELCQAAKDRGFAITPRMIDDWIEQGLLDAPTRKWLGQAKGSTKGTWPETQRELLFVLLDKRREVTHIAPLCNIPVWLWLYYGDHFVPLRQVRRALKTWGGISVTRKGVSIKGASLEKARASARQQVANWGNPHARPKDRKALIEALSQMISCSSFDLDRLVPLLRKVFDPRNTDRPRGPVEAPVTPEKYALLIAVRLKTLPKIDQLDDSLFDWARFMMHTTSQLYLQSQPALAADPELGRLFDRPDRNDVINNACDLLVTTLGLATVVPLDLNDASLHDPETWRVHRLQATILSTEESTGGLRITMAVQPLGE